MRDWLATKQSPHTKRVYTADINDFLGRCQVTLGQFLTSDRHSAFELVSRYQGQLMAQELSSATVNRRLAAIKSLVNHAYTCGHCDFTLAIKSVRQKAYRDTTGINVEAFTRILNQCARDPLKGKRDYALLTLLWGNALRRSEVSKANVKDFDPQAGTLRIYGKGRGHDAEVITLGKQAITAINDWLEARGDVDPNSALFCSVNPGYAEGRLSTQAIYDIVRTLAKKADIGKVLSPHRIRHSAITAALDVTNGDVRRVQKLSRHANLNTLMIYDDNRINHQGEITALLDGLL